MEILRLRYLIIVVFFVLLAASCEYSQLPEPEPPELCESTVVTYADQVKPIIDRTCAIPGCHVSGTKAPGDFTEYQTLSPYLKDSEFKYYVIDIRDDPDLGMPPNWDTNPGPKDLTDEEFEIIECWVSNGYPEQ